MSRHHFVFNQQWSVPAKPSVVLATLADLDDYPTWWPQIRSSRRDEEGSCRLEIRSVLPFSVFMIADNVVDDREKGVLETRLRGDLLGITRWTVVADAGLGSTIGFHEEIEVTRPLLRRVTFARPLFRVNLNAVLSGGEKGMRRHLAA
jgi:hypothetical protein